jgi:hypothetical protein
LDDSREVGCKLLFRGSWVWDVEEAAKGRSAVRVRRSFILRMLQALDAVRCGNWRYEQAVEDKMRYVA